jgi:metal-dependent amidase/aminoacylase/carboxypeptidase family protein
MCNNILLKNMETRGSKIIFVFFCLIVLGYISNITQKQNVAEIAAVTMAEDFSFFQQKVPGLFFFLGAYPSELNLATAPVHHTADFMIDEKSFVTGVKAFLALTTDYMYMKK